MDAGKADEAVGVVHPAGLAVMVSGAQEVVGERDLGRQSDP